MTKLPTISEKTGDVVKATSGLGTAIAALWFPQVALAGPVLAYVTDKFVKRPERILLDRLEGVGPLTEQQMGEFVAMGQRFFEAAKQGEYDHTLKILGVNISEPH